MTTTRITHLRWTIPTALLACLAAACSTSAATSTKAAGASSASTPVLVLRIGTNDNDQTPGAAQIKHFAEEVGTRSHGTIRVEPAWQAAGVDPRHYDQAVAGLLENGKLDLAMIPSRAWDDLGVTSLRALNAPFLITTDSLTRTVVADPALTQKLTSGLPAVGVTALGLYPEGLRHPFGIAKPLLGAGDYRGAMVEAPWSRTADASFEALGAHTSDQDAGNTSMRGVESSYRLSPQGVATGNVVLYPKVNVLSARSDVRDRVGADRWAVLQAAAAATGQWVNSTLPSDQQAARTFCSEAGKIVAATPAQVDSLVAATRPVIRTLRQDPTTAALIDSITALKHDDPAGSPVTSCGTAATAADASLNGSFGFTVSPDQARKAGVTDQQVIDENTGTFVLSFADGTWTIDQVYATGSKAGTKYHATGGYTISGKHLQIFWGHEPGNWTKVDVTVRPDGSLSFAQIHDGNGPQAQAQSESWFTTWKRVRP